MNWKRALIPALVVMPLLVILAMAFGTDPHAIPNVLQGKEAPRFQLQKLGEGGSFSSDALGGKPAVINFWSTWCEPCKVEHDILQRGSQIFKDKVNFVGILYQDKTKAADAYLRNKMNLYTQLSDPDSKVAIEFGVSGVPETFFVDANGVIFHKEAGVVTPRLMTAKLNDLLQGNTGSAQ